MICKPCTPFHKQLKNHFRSIPALRTEQEEPVPHILTQLTIPWLRPKTRNPYAEEKRCQSDSSGWALFCLPPSPYPFLHFSSEKCFSLKVWGDLRVKKLKTWLLLFLIMGFGVFLKSYSRQAFTSYHRGSKRSVYFQSLWKEHPDQAAAVDHAAISSH